MIVAGGFNIYPKEIDEILMGHEHVLEACTIGVPDAYRGETVMAYVVPVPGQDPTEAEILTYCRKHLAAYKVPKQIIMIAELPKTAVGKIMRKEVRKMDQAQQ